MEDIREQFFAGRRQMVDAFVEMKAAARLAGVDEDAVQEIVGRFFDGHVEVRRAFLVASVLAEIRER